MSYAQSRSCDENSEPVGEAPQRGSQVRVKGRRRPLPALQRLRASQREEEKLAFLSQNEESSLQLPLDNIDEEDCRNYSQFNAETDDESFPLGICNACRVLRLPPAIGSQFFETKLRKLHPWQAACLGKVLQVEQSGIRFKQAEACGSSNSMSPTVPNLVYSAPTSGGKTLVAMLLMLRRVLHTGGRALYILPLRATVVEKVNELSALVRPFNQSLSPEDCARHKLVVRNAGANDAKSFRASAANILVCTVEKANLVLNDLLLESADEIDRASAGVGRGSVSLSPPQTPLVSVVVDEAHYLTEKVPLEMLITKLKFLRGAHVRYAGKSTESCLTSAHGGSEGDVALASASKGSQICQVIAFSATLPNAAELASWLDYQTPTGKLHLPDHKGEQRAGSSMSGCVLFQAKERPTPLDLHVACGNNIGLLTLPQLDTILADGSGPTTNARYVQQAGKSSVEKAHSSCSSSSSSSSSSFGPPESNEAERKRFVALVLECTAETSGNSNRSSSNSGGDNNSTSSSTAEGLLVFCGATRECEVEADAIAKARAAVSTSSTATTHNAKVTSKLPLPSLPTEVAAVRRAARKAWERLELPPGSDPTLKPKLLGLLAHGVAFYHAPMPQPAKDEVLAWFKSGAIDVLLATTALAVGVNLPVRCVIIRSVFKWSNVLWEASEVRQMSGRAGRTGQCARGSCIIVAKSTRICLNHARNLFRHEAKAVLSPLAADWRRSMEKQALDAERRRKALQLRAEKAAVQAAAAAAYAAANATSGSALSSATGNKPSLLVPDKSGTSAHENCGRSVDATASSNDVENSSDADVIALVPALRSLCLDGVASGLVRDTVALRRFVESSFLWQSAVASPSSSSSSSSSTSSSSSSSTRSADILNKALNLALQHLLAAKMVELSFSRHELRPDCSGCFGERPRGGETLTVDNLSSSRVDTNGSRRRKRKSSSSGSGVSGNGGASSFARSRPLGGGLEEGEAGGRLVCGTCGWAAKVPLCALPLGRAIFVAGIGPDQGVLLRADVAKAAKQLHLGQGSQHLHALYLLTQPFGSKALYPTARSSPPSSSSSNGLSVNWRMLLQCLPASEAEARAALASASYPSSDGGSVATPGATAGAAAAASAPTLPFGDTPASGAPATAAAASAALAREERTVARRNDAFAATAVFESYDWAVDELSFRASRLPPDAAATLAATYYAATPGGHPGFGGCCKGKSGQLKALNRGAEASLAATCTATKLWGALALRDIQLRDMPPVAANQRYGHGVKDFLEQQTFYMQQVLRFVGELNTKEDSLYCYLKHVVKLLRRPVPRKLSPLFEFLKVGFKPALALKLAAALYQRQVRSIAHVVALPRPRDQHHSLEEKYGGDDLYSGGCRGTRSRRRSRNSSAGDGGNQLEEGPVILQSALVEAGWLNEPEVQRRLAVESLLHNITTTTKGLCSSSGGDGGSSSTTKGNPAAMLAHMAAEVQTYADKVIAMRCKSRRGKRRYERTQSQTVATKVGVTPRAMPPPLPPPHQHQHQQPNNSMSSGIEATASALQLPSHHSPTASAKDSVSSDEELSPLVQGRPNRESDCGYYSGSAVEEDDNSSSNSESETDSSENSDSVSDVSDASNFDASDDEVSDSAGIRGHLFLEDDWAAAVEVEECAVEEVNMQDKVDVANVHNAAANQSATSEPAQALATQILPTQALPSQVELSEKADVALLSMADCAEPGFTSRLRASPANALFRAPFSGLPAPQHSASKSSLSSSTSSPARAEQPTTEASCSTPFVPLSWRKVLESGWRGPLAFAVILRTAPRDVAAGKRSGKGSGKGQGKGCARGADDGQNASVGKGKGGKGGSMPSRSLDWKPLGLGKGLLSSYPGDLLPGGRGCAPALDRAYLVGGMAVVVGSGSKDHFFLPLPTPPPELPPRRTTFHMNDARVLAATATTTTTAGSTTSRRGYSLAQSAVFADPSLLATIAAFRICMPFQCNAVPRSEVRNAPHPWYLDKAGLHSKSGAMSNTTASEAATSVAAVPSVPDLSLLAVNRDWHRAGRRAMIRLLSDPTNSPWALAQRLLENQEEDKASMTQATDPEGKAPARISSVKVANKMQAQAAALRQWCSVVTEGEEIENAKEKVHEDNNGRLGVIVGGWLADPLVASAMLEAAVPTAALGPMVQAAASATAVESRDGNRQQKGAFTAASFYTTSVENLTRPQELAWSGAALRGLRVARAALKHMAALEPLLERFQLTEPFVLVEMPLIPLLAELSTSGMVLDGQYLRRFREEIDEQKNALQRLANKVAPGRGETWANFGGVAVRKASSIAEIHLGSPKDVSEVLEAWNIPTLLRRKNRGLGKSDTKSETLQGYLEDLEAREAAAEKQQVGKPTEKKHQKGAPLSWSWANDALRFLRSVLDYRRLDKLPAALNGLLSFAVKCKVSMPIPAQDRRGGDGSIIPPAYSPRIVDRVIPEVIHAKADAGSKGAGGSSSGVAAAVGLAATGRVSVKPLQHVQKEATFRRPKYKSLQEELLQRRPQELLRVASRCMVVYAGGGGGGGGDASESRSHKPLEVRFGELCDIDTKQAIGDTQAFSDRGNAKKSDRAANAIPSVADYWRSKGFSYSDHDAQRVVCVRVRLDGGGSGGGSLCTYPADQVFRLNGSIDFADTDVEDAVCDDSDAASNENVCMNDSLTSTSYTMPPSSTGTASINNDAQNSKVQGSSVPRTPWCADVKLSPRDVLRASPGRVLLSADFCQVEVRLLAHYSEDPDLLDAFAEPPLGTTDGVEKTKGEDFFRRLARHWHNVPPEVPITVAERSAAKEMCYGIIYGAGEGRVAQMLGISTSAARNHLNEFKSRFRDASEFKERVQRDCSRTDMTVRTLLGRQRLVDRVFTQAVNTVIQGSAADIMKVSMIKIHRRLLLEFGVPVRTTKHKEAKTANQPYPPAPAWVHLERRCRLVNMLHDEVIYDVAVEDFPRVAAIVKAGMEGALPFLKVPLKVELNVGERWGSMKPYLFEGSPAN